MQHNRGWMPLVAIAGVTLTLLIGVYVGAYYSLVSPTRVYEDKSNRRIVGAGYFIGTTPPARMLIPIELSPSYRPILGMRPDRFFFPIHWLDRRLRPQTWRQEMMLYHRPQGPSIHWDELAGRTYSNRPRLGHVIP